MLVFSHTTRNDPSPVANGEDTFAFLERVSGQFWDQVRDLVEDWASHVDVDALPSIVGRLKSGDDRQFRSAFLELYVHESLLRMGYTVVCEPTVAGTDRRPDFLAMKDGRSFYVEARHASHSDRTDAESRRLSAVYDAINRIESPNFYLWVSVNHRSDQPLGTKNLRRRLKEWLNSLNPDDPCFHASAVGDDGLALTHNEAGWSFTFRPIAKTAGRRGLPGQRTLGVFGGTEASWVDDVGTLRSALADKGTAYGDLHAPFVVAVGMNTFGDADEDVTSALYGTESHLLHIDDDGSATTTPHRTRDGYWLQDQWVHRGVSAVLMVQNLHPAFIAKQQHSIWEHPDPLFPLERLPLWRRCILGPDGQISATKPDRTQAEWFDLDAEWPIGEAFPPTH